ncbi:MAG: Ig-like domain-containing protein [Bacteroidales bacterium]|nr:Ig-like domain-containing protein [Bacteroidales bacterium]
MVKHLIRWVVCLCLCATGINTAWADTTTFDFTQISGFSSWTNGYTEHVVDYAEATVTFQAASKQGGTITDMPVTKGSDVSFVLKNKEQVLTSVEFQCKQWGSKAQTITLNYSTDGGTTYATTDITSSNFSLSANSLPDNTNAVKFTFSSTSNQIGIQSLTISYDIPNNDLTPVDISTFQTVNESTTLGIYKSIATDVTPSHTGWTPADANAPYTYSSSHTNIADIDENGVIHAKKVGNANITVRANVAETDATYRKGASKTIAIEVVDNRKVVNLTEFTAASNEIIVGNTMTTTVRNNQSDWTPKYTYTSDNTSVAEVNEEGVVTAKMTGTAKITVTSNIDNEDSEFKAGTKSKYITFTVKNPSHKVIFMVDGQEASWKNVEEGKTISFPTPDESQLADNLVFAGWSTCDLDGMVYNAPELVDTKNAIMGNADTTFYAVFARIAQAGKFESDTLTTEMITNEFNKKSHSYGTELKYQNGSVTWLTDSYAEKKANYLQTNNKKGDSSKGTYVAFEAPYNIKTIKFELATSSSSTIIYANEEPKYESIKGSTKGSTTLSSAKSGEISIEGEYNKLYLQSSAVAKFSSVTLIGNVIEPRYAGYVTDTKDANNTPRTVEVTIASCGYTTVCLPYNAVAPEATLYALKSIDQNGLHFSKIDILAAGQGYVLQGKACEHYTLTEVLEAVDYNANMLKGVVEQTNCEDLQLHGPGDYDYPWILAKDGTFKRYTGAYIPAGKAYLDGALLQDLQANQASALRVILEEDEVTALSQLHEEKASAPCYYNLQGQRVAQPRQAGALYIESNGRKIIVK